MDKVRPTDKGNKEAFVLLFLNLLAKYSDEVSVINNNGGII